MAQSNKRNYNRVKKQVKKQVKKMSPKSIAICCVVFLALVVVALVGAFIYNDCDFNKTKTFIIDLFYHQCRYDEDVYYNNGSYHWHKCSKCGEEVAKTTHTWVKDEASEDDGAYICTICGKTKSISRPTGQTTVVETLEDLKIHFVDVGQGDCIIIEFPDGKNMIIDAGDDNGGRSTANEKAIKAKTDELGITKFDYMLLTHQDSDHAGNMDYVFETYEIGYVFKPYVLSQCDGSVNVNGKSYSASDLNEGLNVGHSGNGIAKSTSKTYLKFLVDLQLEGCGFENFNLDSDFSNKVKYNEIEYEYKFDFLTPTADVQDIKYEDANDYSPICILEYSGKKIMLTGDAESFAEEEYVNKYGNVNNVDVLKVGHHGSLTSSRDIFLEAIDPEYAVICVGEGNEYSHPRQETLTRLVSYGATTIYRTDNNGDIVLSVNIDGGIDFKVEKECSQEENRIGLTKTSFFGNEFVIIREEEIIFDENSKIKKVA